jgi:hypothetical protein
MALTPGRTAMSLSLNPATTRGVTEVRAGMGGTMAGLGLWALARGTSDAYTAVGVTCLGAAAARAYSLKADAPKTDASFWGLLAGEVFLGITGVLARGRS